LRRAEIGLRQRDHRGQHIHTLDSMQARLRMGPARETVAPVFADFFRPAKFAPAGDAIEQNGIDEK
jgi:hypothetical protein